MTDASYSRLVVEWVLRNLLELRQGIWPDPEPAELHPMSRYIKGHHAAFEVPAGMAALVELKIKATGLDGLMTKVYFIMNEPDADLAKIARCSVRQVSGKIENVLKYISGKPKAFEDGTLKTYRQFTGHRR